jgi:RNA polymerase sigma-70 factor (ECF subfamily)
MMPAEQDVCDADLVEGYRRGDADALQKLVVRHRQSLFGFIHGMTGGQTAEADDVFQEVWFRVIRKLRLYRHDNFPGWLMRIAHNVVVDRARRQKPAVRLDAEDNEGCTPAGAIAGDGPTPAERAISDELGRRIAEAVASLPAEQKAVFLMRTEAGLSFKEIASAQRVSINTALGRMQYALVRLRTALRADYEEMT